MVSDLEKRWYLTSEISILRVILCHLYLSHRSPSEEFQKLGVLLQYLCLLGPESKQLCLLVGAAL
jgi:hypothetical protein